jgi:excisionase family DNA binding protein
MTSPALTPPQVARLLAVKADKVLAWIGAGELAAVDVRSPGATRPRWRITQEALDGFLARRSARPMPVRLARPRQPGAADNPFGLGVGPRRRSTKKAVPARTAAEP